MAKFFTPSKLSENMAETPEGFLMCLNVPIARTGWQEYGPGETPLEVGDDGKVWIYRDANEVFRPQTIASFQAKSITIKHPDDFVKPENWRQLSNGSIQNVRRAGEKDEDGEEMLLADLLVTDHIAIELIKQGLREVSCGYDAEYEETGKGEGRQFNITGNHCALVEQGRAGSSYAIKDHKGKVTIMSVFNDVKEALKGLGKTLDEAISEQEKTKKPPKKTQDDSGMADKPEQVTYDDMVKHIKDLSMKMDAMMEKKPSGQEKEKIGDDESDEDQEVGQNGRLEKLEAAVAKILKMLGNKGAEDDDEDGDDGDDMVGDDDEDGDDMVEDEEGEEGEESQKKMKKTGDAARFEILTPGKKFSGDDARVKCLKAFAKTEDGAKVLKSLGMKKPVFDSKTNSDMIFMAASALVKTQRGVGLQGTKDGGGWDTEDTETKAPMTIEKMNEINAKHYGGAK